MYYTSENYYLICNYYGTSLQILINDLSLSGIPCCANILYYYFPEETSYFAKKL